MSVPGNITTGTTPVDPEDTAIRNHALLLILVAALGSARPGAAQVGVFAGVNLANLRGAAVDDASLKVGLTAGGFVSLRLAPLLAVQPEVRLTVKGATSNRDRDENIVTLRYLELPVLLVVRIPTSGEKIPRLLFGPALGLNLSADADIPEPGGPLSNLSVTDNVRRIDWGLVAGGRLDMPIGRGAVLFGARYTLGLSNIFKRGPVDVKNGTFSITMGYGWGR